MKLVLALKGKLSARQQLYGVEREPLIYNQGAMSLYTLWETDLIISDILYYFVQFQSCSAKTFIIPSGLLHGPVLPVNYLLPKRLVVSFRSMTCFIKTL